MTVLKIIWRATFDWLNETMYYEDNGYESKRSKNNGSKNNASENKKSKNNGSENNGAKSGGPGFFALVTFFINFSVMAKVCSF